VWSNAQNVGLARELGIRSTFWALPPAATGLTPSMPQLTSPASPDAPTEARYGRVTAPSEAEETRRAYFASTPCSYAGGGD
jgi:hypothetical protein